LLAAARQLFAQRGYTGVGTDEIAQHAGVTRGALYHHFADKRDLLRALYEQLEAELAERLVTAIPEGASVDDALQTGYEMFLDACLEPDMQQIVLRDAPAVLGWEEWREISARHGLGLIEALLTTGMATGEITPQPVRPLAHAMLGALDEIALLVARADNTATARTEAAQAFTTFITGLRNQ
jgi:AcrR family transcriptional regulator